MAVSKSVITIMVDALEGFVRKLLILIMGLDA
jgi:hypothetical protein